MSRTERRDATIAPDFSRRAPLAGARPEPGQRWWRWLKLLVVCIGCLAFGFTVAGALLYVHLLHGPVSLQVLVKPIEAGIGEELPGYKVRVAAAAVRLGERGGLEFELSQVQINDAD